MTRLDEIKQQYAESEQCKNIEELGAYLVFENGGFDRVINIIAEKYAEECIKASLTKASEESKIKYHNGVHKINKLITYYQFGADNLQIDKDSIIDSNNIVIL